ncbi:SCO7613 C-terminal domain-containing membrane protein [Nocardiopsis sp. NPDC058631]|uniref:SCO7613 C-terminal domain-containing membrane protein n=1 Tax=Nocardiopsis sp. NPDC058631 TaxID=3346566 RepID=UPI00365B55B8
MNAHGSPPPPAGPRLHCPDCRSPLPFGTTACPRCGLRLTGDTARRLWWIDSEIAELDGRRHRLLGERAAVVRLLRRESIPRRTDTPPPANTPTGGRPGDRTPSHGPVHTDSGARPSAGAAGHGAAAPAPAGRHGSAPTGEVTRRSAQNLILGLGGLLVGIAALVFAVWSWSDLGTGARAGVLGATTLAFAVLALPLHRRGLRATAETFGCVAAALLCVDALALGLLLSDRITSGPGYAAAALTAIGALAALYPLLVPLRSPRVVAALVAQPVPVLLVAALPGGGALSWILPALAATALTDLLLVRLLGGPRQGIPVRTLHVTATVLWGFALVLSSALMLAVPEARNAGTWWAVASALLVSGVTGLLFTRRPLPSLPRPGARPSVLHAAVALLALGAVPLAAGPAHLPVLPGAPSGFWTGDPGAATAPALHVLELTGPGTLVPPAPAYLAAVAVAAVLALAAVALLRRDLLVPATALVAPPALLAVPLLLSLPLVVAVVWALLVGAALVLGTVLLPRRRAGWVCTAAGSLTVATGVLWSLPDRYTSLAALLLTGTTALVALLLFRRADRNGRAAASLYGSGLLLWALTLLTGAGFLTALALGLDAPRPAWWLLAAAALMAGATALLLGRLRYPFASQGSGGAPGTLPRAAVAVPGGGWAGAPLPARGAPDPRPAFTLFGLLLLATAPLLAGSVRGPGLSPLSGPYQPWTAPVSAMLDPAHEVLGLSAPEGFAAALGTALGVLVAGALVVALVLLVDRRWAVTALALAAPTALVPLPVLLGMPYVAAVVWTVFVGAALVLGVAPSGRSGLGWVPAATGCATLLLGLFRALPEYYTTLAALVLVAATSLVAALVLRRMDFAGGVRPGTAARAVPLALGGLTLLVGGAALVFSFTRQGPPEPLSWWLSAAALLCVGAASVTVARPTPPSPVPAPPAPAPRPVPGMPPLTLLGLLLLAAVPLVAGPRSLPALAAVPRAHPVASAPPSVLLDPAYAVLGLSPLPGPALAAAVAAGVLVSGLLSVGAVALLARRWTPRAAALVVPPALAPLPVITGAPFLVALLWVLAVGSALAVWSALLRDRRTSPLPGLTGLLTAGVGLSWSLAEEHTTAGALMAAAVVASVVAALARTPVPALGGTAAATSLTGAFSLTLPLALGAPVEYAVLGPIAVVAAVAVVAPRLRGALVTAAEVPACLWAVLALAVSVGAGARPELVALALALVGVVAAATAVRPGRSWFAAVGGLLMFAALWTVLSAWHVTVPEAYTVPPALAALVIGWEWSRKAVTAPSSWAAYGGGLALLLLPTVGLLLTEDGMAWRVPAVLVLGVAVALWGLVRRLQAALVLGGLVLVATSLRAFGPPLWELTRVAPNWVPFAAVGLLLLLVGARYEASLARLRSLGRVVSGMR